MTSSKVPKQSCYIVIDPEGNWCYPIPIFADSSPEAVKLVEDREGGAVLENNKWRVFELTTGDPIDLRGSVEVMPV